MGSLGSRLWDNDWSPEVWSGHGVGIAACREEWKKAERGWERTWAVTSGMLGLACMEIGRCSKSWLSPLLWRPHLPASSGCNAISVKTSAERSKHLSAGMALQDYRIWCERTGHLYPCILNRWMLTYPWKRERPWANSLQLRQFQKRAGHLRLPVGTISAPEVVSPSWEASTVPFDLPICNALSTTDSAWLRAKWPSEVQDCDGASALIVWQL